MSMIKLLKEPQRNSMMNLFGGQLATSLAHPIRSLHGRYPGSLPSDPIGFRCPAFPSWVCRAALELRLPFGHAGIAAKDQDGMEVTGWASYRFFAPIARLTDQVRSCWVRLTYLPFLAAFEGTVFLISLPGANTCQSAYFARGAGLYAAPSVAEVTPVRAECRRRSAVLGVKCSVANSAMACDGFISHALSISHIEIEERYCEIAANRLRQGVLWGAE